MLNALPVSAGNDDGEFQLRIKAADFSLFSIFNPFLDTVYLHIVLVSETL